MRSMFSLRSNCDLRSYFLTYSTTRFYSPRQHIEHIKFLSQGLSPLSEPSHRKYRAEKFRHGRVLNLLLHDVESTFKIRVVWGSPQHTICQKTKSITIRTINVGGRLSVRTTKAIAFQNLLFFLNKGAIFYPSGKYYIVSEVFWYFQLPLKECGCQMFFFSFTKWKSQTLTSLGAF